MQVAIELPDELGEQLLQQTDVNQFVQEAIEKMLLEQKFIQNSGKDNENERRKFLAMLNEIKPVKCKYSSVEMGRMLREGKAEELFDNK